MDPGACAPGFMPSPATAGSKQVLFLRFAGFVRSTIIWPAVERLLRSFGGWGDGDEVFGEAVPVFVEEIVDSLELWCADD